MKTSFFCLLAFATTLSFSGKAVAESDFREELIDNGNSKRMSEKSSREKDNVDLNISSPTVKSVFQPIELISNTSSDEKSRNLINTINLKNQSSSLSISPNLSAAKQSDFLDANLNGNTVAKTSRLLINETPLSTVVEEGSEDRQTKSRSYSSVESHGNLDYSLTIPSLGKTRNNIDEELINTSSSRNKIAQATANNFNRRLSGFSTLDFIPSTSPAARVIEYSPVNTISAPDKVGFQLLNGLNSEGKFGTGISVDIAPYLIIKNTDFTLEQYRESYLSRFLANTKLSVATTKADNSARIGVGIEFILFRDGDPRLDNQLLDGLKKVIKDELNGPSAPAPGASQGELDKFSQDVLKPALEAVKTNPENKRRLEQKQSMSLGFATSWVSPTANYRDFSSDGSGIWTTYQTGIGNDSQLLFHGFYRNGANLTNRNGVSINGSNLLLGARIQTGIDTKLSVESSYNIENSTGKESNGYLAYGIGLDTPIKFFKNSEKEANNLFFSLSLTGYSGRQNGGDFQMLSGIKWSFNDGQ
jgi:hypothetical protein